MRKCLVFGFLCLQPFAALASDDEFLSLQVEIHVDGERVSTPRIVLEPGTDGSILQELDDGLAVKFVFHSTHAGDSAGVLMDVDAGMRASEHLESRHLAMPWNEPFEFLLSTAPDGHSIRLVITPSLVTRDDVLLLEETGK